MKDTDVFYLNKDEPNKSCLLALRQLILAQDEHITETIKYGMPCFCYRNKMFCYLWVDKITREPYILMVEGKHLAHARLEAGTRSKMKVFRVKADEDLPLNDLRMMLKGALDLYRNGVVKVK